MDLGLQRRKKFQPVEKVIALSESKYKVEILQGTPGPTIVDYANKEKFDIRVIGGRGLNSLQEMVLGSVSHKAVKHANCPALIVK